MEYILFYIPQIRFFMICLCAILFLKYSKKRYDRKQDKNILKECAVAIVGFFLASVCFCITVVEAVDHTKLQVVTGEIVDHYSSGGYFITTSKIELVNEKTGKKGGYFIYFWDDWLDSGDVEIGDTVTIRYSLISKYVYDMERVD